MAVATRPSVCAGCGQPVAAGDAFCPVCGTRLVPDRPMPVRVGPADTERAARSTNGWLLAALVVTALVLAVAGLVGAWIGAQVAEVDPGGAAGDGDAAAAESMDA